MWRKKMRASKRKRLEAKGWRLTSAEEFLGLTREEVALVEMKLALADAVKAQREKSHLSQVELANRMKSSQSRVAKIEAGDPSVSLDLLLGGTIRRGDEEAGSQGARSNFKIIDRKRRMAKSKDIKGEAHKWQFKARFRRHAFGWRSQPAIKRLKEALSEIKQVARKDPMIGAEGAVSLLERISPALENVDSSSGAIGAAVNKTIAELVPIVASAPADTKTRDAWLERLWAAHEADQIPYIEQLADHWGDLCASTELASAWADGLLNITRMALSPDQNLRGHFHGTSACLSSLYRAERYDEIVKLLDVDTIWLYKRWAVKALNASGKKREAIRYAEACRDSWASDLDIDAMCEEILMSSGLVDEAYERYGLRANRAGTYVATFRAVAKKYPHKRAGKILEDLVKTTPGDAGKWFAAAKEAGLYDAALALAALTPCDPKTLARAARDSADDRPAFAADAGLLALHWLVQGYGYEITSDDVWMAFEATVNAAEKLGTAAETRERVRTMITASVLGDDFVKKILGGELDLL